CRRPCRVRAPGRDHLRSRGRLRAGWAADPDPAPLALGGRRCDQRDRDPHLPHELRGPAGGALLRWRAGVEGRPDRTGVCPAVPHRDRRAPGAARVLSARQPRRGGRIHRPRADGSGGSTMRVLIAVASRHGSTYEIAEVIAAEVRAAGDVVDLRAAEDVDSLESYDAVVLGSAVYMGKWLPEARQF